MSIAFAAMVNKEGHKGGGKQSLILYCQKTASTAKEGFERSEMKPIEARIGIRGGEDGIPPGGGPI